MTNLVGSQGAAARQGIPPDLASAPQEEKLPWLLGFFCLLLLAVPGYLVPPGPLKGNGHPVRLIALLFFFLAVVSFIAARSEKAMPGRINPGAILLCAYPLLSLSFYGTGLLITPNPALEDERIRGLLSLAITAGTGLYTMFRVKSYRQRSFVLGCLAVGLTFNAIVGLLQNSTGIDLRLLFQPPGFQINTSPEGGDIAPTLTERFGARRSTGTSQHPIEFAVLTAICVPLNMYFAACANHRLTRQIAFLGSLVALVSMPAGVSRSGVIALAAAMAIYIWTFSVRQIATGLTLTVVALIAELSVAPHTVEALWKTITNSSEDQSVLSRVADYERVAKSFHEHPFIGSGMGASSPAIYGYLDNQWLQAVVQGGFVGVFAMLMLTAAGVAGFTGGLRRASNPQERNQAYALGAMFAGVIASSFTFDLFGFAQATLVLFIVCGLLWSTDQPSFLARS